VGNCHYIGAFRHRYLFGFAQKGLDRRGSVFRPQRFPGFQDCCLADEIRQHQTGIVFNPRGFKICPLYYLTYIFSTRLDRIFLPIRLPKIQTVYFRKK
jgi:hypothetical protein